MKIKVKNLVIYFIMFTIFLTVISILTVNSFKNGNIAEIGGLVTEKPNLPEISVVEIEEEIIVEKPIVTYDFPFEMAEKGIYLVKGVCNDCLPQREYKLQEGFEGVTVFASDKVIPEGALIWLEGIGIRQVQTVYTDYEGILVFFDNHEDAKAFEEKSVLVYDILE